MAAVNLTFQGMFYDKISRVYYENATMVGVAFLTDLTVGGGPIIPPDKPPGGPPFYPAHPGPILPGDPGWGPPYPIQPPPVIENPPQPGDPTKPLPPPAGQPGWPVQPITPPPFIVVQYPGIGPVVVAPPAPPSSG